MKKHYLFLVLVLLSTNPVFSQLKIISSTVSELLVTPESINRPVINVGTSIQNIHIFTEVQDLITSEVILSCLTNPIEVRSGINAIQPKMNFFQSIGYGNSRVSDFLRIHKKLPTGKYRYCIKVHSIDDEYFEDEWCDDLLVVVNEFLHLIHPSDRDTITTLLPVLSWNTSAITEMKLGVKNYRLVLSDKEDEDDAETAIAINKSVFIKENLQNLSIPYPSSAKALQKGHTYVWKVDCLVDDQVVEQSETWEFTIKEDIEKNNPKYIVLQQDFGLENYIVENGKIYFAFKERYFGESEFPKFQIRTVKDELIEEPITYDNDKIEAKTHANEVATEKNKVVMKTNQGFNRYILDITKYNLKPGSYIIEIWNFKDELYRLRFLILN